MHVQVFFSFFNIFVLQFCSLFVHFLNLFFYNVLQSRGNGDFGAGYLGGLLARQRDTTQP